MGIEEKLLEKAAAKGFFNNILKKVLGRPPIPKTPPPIPKTPPPIPKTPPTIGLSAKREQAGGVFRKSLKNESPEDQRLRLAVLKSDVKLRNIERQVDKFFKKPLG